MELKGSGQPLEFVGWWELVFYTLGGHSQNIEGIIEHILPDSRFEVFRNGDLIAGGFHTEFQMKPPGFTNVQNSSPQYGATRRELVIYRLDGSLLEVCKAPESDGRPARFGSPEGTSIVHSTLRRISASDPRIPGYEVDPLY